MKFTKKQALDLFAILSHYEAISERINVNVLELRDEVEDFILSEENNEKTNEYGETEEDSEEEDEEECDEQDQKIDENQVTNYVQSKRLKSLTKCQATTIRCPETNYGEKVSLRFGFINNKTVLFVKSVDEEFVIEPILYIRRKGTQLSLSIADSVVTCIFEINKFPKDWTKMLTINDLIEVVNYEI